MLNDRELMTICLLNSHPYPYPYPYPPLHPYPGLTLGVTLTLVLATPNTNDKSETHLVSPQAVIMLGGKCRFHWVFNIFHGTWTTKL